MFSLVLSVHNRPHGHSVIAHPCWGTVGTPPAGMLSCFEHALVITICSRMSVFRSM